MHNMISINTPIKLNVEYSLTKLGNCLGNKTKQLPLKEKLLLHWANKLPDTFFL